MIVIDGPVSPQDTTAFAREIPYNLGRPLLGAADVTTKPSNKIAFSEITRRNRAAKYRTFDGAIHASSRDGAQTTSVEMPPFSSSLSQGEYERLRLEFARLGGTNDGALASAIYDDVDRLTNEILNRAELALGEVRSTGRFTINENGLNGFEIDYGVTEEMRPTPAALWSSGSARIWSDILAFNDAYRKRARVRAGRMEVSTDVLRLILSNDEVVNNVYGTAAGRQRATLGDLNSQLVSEGLAPLVDVETARIDMDGTDTDVVDPTQVRLLPADDSTMFEFAFGTTATALELVNDPSTSFGWQDAPGIAGVVIKTGPPFRQYTFVDAVGLPILHGAERLLIAKVTQ